MRKAGQDPGSVQVHARSVLTAFTGPGLMETTGVINTTKRISPEFFMFIEAIMSVLPLPQTIEECF